MNGRVLVVLLLGFALIFGGVLWYFQTRAFYAPVTLVQPGLPQTDVAAPASAPQDRAPMVQTGDGDAASEPSVGPLAAVQPGATAPVAAPTHTPEPAAAPVAPGSVTLTMVRLSDLAPEPILAANFQGIDAATSPLKFRACFTVENSLAYMTETYVVVDQAEPLRAPSWFSCFDVETLTDDLENGTALAFLASEDQQAGVDRLIAVYGDGRAFAWNQFNECGRARLEGETPASDCATSARAAR